MNKATKKILVKYVAAPLLLLVLLYLIYKQIQSKGSLSEQWLELKQHWHSGSALLILIALFLSPLNWLTEAKKWHLLLQKVETVSYRTALASTFTGMAFALVTPNKIGDFAGRILYVKNNNKLRAIIATIINNISQVIITFITGIIGLTYLNICHPGNWQLLALIAAIVSSTLLLWMYFRIDLVATWVEKKSSLRSVVVTIRVLKRYQRKDLLQVLFIALFRFIIYNIQFVLFIKIFGADISFLIALLLSAAMFWLITIIPSIFVADLGVRAFISNLLFVNTGLVANSVTIIAGSYMIWLLNWAIPATIGAVLVLTVKWFK